MTSVTSNDRAYFLRRAREERALAQSCEDNAVALVHSILANAYEKKLATGRPHLAIVGNG